jgi:fructokinase
MKQAESIMALSPIILSFGEVLWDLFPAGPQLGGAPANFSCHAALQGGEVSLVSSVGDDQLGRGATQLLRQYPVGLSLLQTTAAAPTGSVGVSLDAHGSPTFTIHSPAAWDFIEWTDELAAEISFSQAVYFGTLGQRSEGSRPTIRQALQVAHDAGVRRVLDINLRKPFYDAALIEESLQLASLLKLSAEELPIVAAACGISSGSTAEMLRSLLTKYDLELVAMTLGADGALLVTAADQYAQPGFPTVVRDTVGAGDSFTAALVMGVLKHDPPPTVLRNACELAARTCAHAGALPPV